MLSGCLETHIATPTPAPTADLRSGAKGSREVVRKGSREVVLKPAVTYKMSSILVCSKIIGQRSAQRHVLRDWRIVALEENGGKLTFLDLFQGINLNLLSCLKTSLAVELSQLKESDFQMVPLHVQVGQAVPIFGKFVKTSS